jgi:phage terminase small subunit
MTRPRRPQTRPLTPRQSLFVAEYLVDLNAKQAAIRAGYAPGSAADRGWELLHRCPAVMARLKQAMAEREQRTQIGAERVLKEIARIAFADIRNYLMEGPEKTLVVRPLTQLSDDDVAALAEVQADGEAKELRRIRLHDKRAALELLARHLGLVGKRSDSPPPPHRGADARQILRERLMRDATATLEEQPAALEALKGA